MGRFKWPTTRNTDPQTSHDAASKAAKGSGTLRKRCFIELQNVGPDGLTDFELADRVGSQQTSAGKRRGELVESGLVEATNRRRPSPSGASAIVWRIRPGCEKVSPDSPLV